nr:type II toxin-antitoxin system Phd/YefM family antitoxin [Mammaliicoccus sp. Marseille-Q6498]
MIATTFSNAKSNLRTLIDQVNNDSEHIVITTKKHNAVLISEGDYNSMMETLYLLQSPANAERLANSIANIKNGITTEINIDSYA